MIFGFVLLALMPDIILLRTALKMMSAICCTSLACELQELRVKEVSKYLIFPFYEKNPISGRFRSPISIPLSSNRFCISQEVSGSKAQE
jgi:hypothetical protein